MSMRAKHCNFLPGFLSNREGPTGDEALRAPDTGEVLMTAGLPPVTVTGSDVRAGSKFIRSGSTGAGLG